MEINKPQQPKQSQQPQQTRPHHPGQEQGGLGRKEQGHGQGHGKEQQGKPSYGKPGQQGNFGAGKGSNLPPR